MQDLPHLRTPRLLLRPFSIEDAPAVTLLAGDRAVASTAARIPHPYEEGMAEAWIATHPGAFRDGQSVVLAITLPADNRLVGAIGLEISGEDRRGELGYWVGKPYWNRGYATEASQAVLEYGFQVLDLDRIYAHHFLRNPASGRVMQKAGMKHEGCLRQHVLKWGAREDLEVYGILKAEHRPPGTDHP